MSEFAFDVTLAAVVRVEADTREQAVAAVRSLVAVDVSASVDLPGERSRIVLTEVSAAPGQDLRPFEIDGRDEDEI